MEDKRCLVLVDGKECGLPLSQIDREAEKIARYDLATYQCCLGHRSYFLLEPELSRASAPEWQK
jgi:hypothetical protein